MTTCFITSVELRRWMPGSTASGGAVALTDFKIAGRKTSCKIELGRLNLIYGIETRVS